MHSYYQPPLPLSILQQTSSSNRYWTIRRASGASMAARCFPARRESSILQPKTAPHVIERERRTAVEKVLFISGRRKSGVLHIVDICLDGLAGKPCLGPARLLRQGIQARGEFFVQSYGKHGSSPFLCLHSIAQKAVPMSSLNRLAAVPGFSRPSRRSVSMILISPGRFGQRNSTAPSDCFSSKRCNDSVILCFFANQSKFYSAKAIEIDRRLASNNFAFFKHTAILFLRVFLYEFNQRCNRGY